MATAKTTKQQSKADEQETPTALEQWKNSIASALLRLRRTVDGESEDFDEEALREQLTETLAIIASNPDALIEYKGWLLAEAAEAAAFAVLKREEVILGPNNSSAISKPDLAKHVVAIAEAWDQYANRPAEQEKIVSMVESLKDLKGVSDKQICEIFHDADPIEDEDAKWGKWMLSEGAMGRPNFDRLLMAKQGRVKTPATRTRIVRPTHWPDKMPLLLSLKQVAALVDA